MAKVTTTLTIEINDEEVDCTAHCSISKYCPATWDSPAEGGEVEDMEVVRDDTKQDVTHLLSKGQIEHVEQELLDQAESDADDARASRYDHDYDE